MPMQPEWRFCRKCYALFYDGFPSKGRCHADGGGHEAAGFNFVLPHDVSGTPTAQDSWRFCHLCNEMFYDGRSDKGHCPGGALDLSGLESQTAELNRPIVGVPSADAGTQDPPGGPAVGNVAVPHRSNRGGHEAAGFNFVLPHDIPGTSTAQDSWRFCHLCNAMYYDGFPDNGRCVGSGGGHEAAGFTFVLPHDLPSVLDFDFDPIVFGTGIATGGSAHLTFRQDGSYTFTGHFHDSGAAEYNVSLVWVVKDSQNGAYTTSHSGHISGTFESGSRDDDWRIDSRNDNIANNWVSLAAGSISHPVASASGDVTGLANTALAAVGTVLAVVALA